MREFEIEKYFFWGKGTQNTDALGGTRAYLRVDFKTGIDTRVLEAKSTLMLSRN